VAKVVSAVIVTWNSRETVGECLKSLLPQVSEILVVDNSSKDGTAEFIAKNFPKIKLVENKKNIGFAKAVNQGMRRARSKYILMLNPDTVLKEGALEKMVAFADSDPKIGIVGPKLVFPDGTVQKEVQRFPTLWPMVFWLFRLHRIPPFPNLPPLRGFLLRDFDYEKTQVVEHLLGAALLLRWKMLDEIGLSSQGRWASGPFDENFWLWFEETDLEKRAKEAGWKVVYYPKAEVIHQVGESTRKMNPFRLQYIWNNSLRYYFKKHRPFWEQIVLEPFLWLSFVPLPLFVLGKKVRGIMVKR